MIRRHPFAALAVVAVAMAIALAVLLDAIDRGEATPPSADGGAQ